MSNNNIILTGIPRSGTTLACYLLSQIPDFVALNEPMRTVAYKSYRAALKGVPEFYEMTRQSILNKGVAIARAVNGKMTDNHFSNEMGVRKKLVKKQEIKIDKILSTDFKLGIKHNALFTILLTDLVKEYPVFAFIRNPLSVLGSWNSLDLPASKGEVRAARWLYPELDTALAHIPDIYDRQLYILNWYYEKYLILPSKQVIKYESIISTSGAALNPISSKAVQLNKELSSKNKNKVYDKEVIAKLADKLLNSDHSCWQFYDRKEVEQVL